MKTKSLLSAAALLAFSLPSPAQQPQIPVPAPVQQPAPVISNAIFINVLGAVNQPARVNLPRGSGLLDVIAATGGLLKSADLRKITVIHKSAGDRADSVKIDLVPIMQGATRDITMRDGDTVVITEKLINF